MTTVIILAFKCHTLCIRKRLLTGISNQPVKSINC